MKYYYLFGLFLFLFLTSCQKEEKEPETIVCCSFNTDLIQVTGLYGNWEIQSRTIDNISDASATCCEYFEFNLDQYPEDFEGLFKKTSAGVDLVGGYVIDPDSSTILLSFMGNEQELNYSVMGGVLILEYNYNDQDYYEIWKKISEYGY